jgi:hypothetical protein
MPMKDPDPGEDDGIERRATALGRVLSLLAAGALIAYLVVTYL